MPGGWHVQDGLGGGKGRGVVADKAFKPGDTVLEDSAYAFAIITGELSNWCDCCLAPVSQPLRCSACKMACYASRDHQARAWRACHREECAALRSCAPHLPPTAVRLALKCVLRSWKERQAAGKDAQALQKAEGRLLQLLGLCHHWEQLPDASKLEFAQMGALAHRLLTVAAPELAEGDEWGPQDLSLLIARFGCNSHTISTDELTPVAVGIFPLGSMVNHDCSPNTLHSFVGPRMLFRAVRDSQPGEEVTTTYTELAATRWERRRELLHHHLFDIDAPTAASSSDSQSNGSSSGGEGAAAAAGAGQADGGVPPSPPSSPAAAALRQAALLCLPQQQAAATLPLVLQGSTDVSTGELRLYNCKLPPWQHDARDTALTALQLAGASTAAEGSSSSCGGMWGALRPAGGSVEDAVSASFDISDEPELGRLVHAASKPGGSGVGASSSSGGAAAATAAGPGGSSQLPAVLIHCWRHPSPAEAPSQQQEEQEQQQWRQAAAELAQHYAAALQLQQAVDGMLARGHAAAAAAASQLQRALQLLGGGTSSSPSPSTHVSATSRATARLALGPRHELRMWLLADLLRAAVAAQQWEPALAAAYQLLPLYIQVYPQVCPQLGLLWANVAKIEHLLERPGKALEAATQALRILTITQGSSGGFSQSSLGAGGGSVVEQLRQVQFEAAQELQQRQLAAAAGADDDD